MRASRPRRRGLLAALLLLWTMGGPARAETLPQQRALGMAPSGILWIGNSLFYMNNGIVSHLRPLLAEMAVPDVHHTLITIAGAGFDWHDVESYFRPDAIGRYSFTPQNEIRFNPGGARYDLAVMMDCSLCPLHPELREGFFRHGLRHAATVRRHGATPVFFMTWAYADQPGMTEALAEAYTKLGNEAGALVIPAGLAFARAAAERPFLDLYAADRRHPSLAGTYLAAAVSLAALYGISPEPAGYRGGLRPGVARFLRRIAWETVRDYHRR